MIPSFVGPAVCLGQADAQMLGQEKAETGGGMELTAQEGTVMTLGCPSCEALTSHAPSSTALLIILP